VAKDPETERARRRERHERVVKLAATMSPQQRLELARDLQVPVRVKLHDGTTVTGYTLGVTYGNPGYSFYATRRDGTRCLAWQVGRASVPDDIDIELLPHED
jgi:hypothetical protein